VLPGSGTASNSQYTLSAVGASVSAGGNTLTVTLPVTFSAAFAGNRIVYLAGYGRTQASGWQAVGTIAVE